MAATVKAWHRDDCRRLSIDLEQIQYQDLKKKLQNTFQLDNEFMVKYTDMDGDLCTIGGNEEYEDLLNSEQVKERKGTIRLQVIPNGSRRPSILHRRDSSSDQSGTSTLADGKTSRPLFDGEYTDCDMLEILRDISHFICTRGIERGENEGAMADLPPGASSWVSTEKNLITPTTAHNFQRLNFARAVRAKFPATSGSEILGGLDGHVDKWDVETTGQWLAQNGYEDTVTIFKEHDITGYILLDLTHDILKDMGMVIVGRRMKLLKLIAELRLHVADISIKEATDEALALEGLAIN